MGVDQATGIPCAGGMVAKLVQKHPILMQIAPMFLKGRSQGPQQPQAGGNGVGYG